MLDLLAIIKQDIGPLNFRSARRFNWTW